MGKNIQSARTGSSPHRKVIPSQSKLLWKLEQQLCLVLRLITCEWESLKNVPLLRESKRYELCPLTTNKCSLKYSGLDLPYCIPQGLLCSKNTDPLIPMCSTLGFKMLRKIGEGGEEEDGDRRQLNKKCISSSKLRFQYFWVKAKKAE